MIDHAGFGVRDYARSKAFYEQALAPLGITLIMEPVGRAAGLAAGGTDNGAPGVRDIYHPDYYGAFVLDPDGNNVEAVCHKPA